MPFSSLDLFHSKSDAWLTEVFPVTKAMSNWSVFIAHSRPEARSRAPEAGFLRSLLEFVEQEEQGYAEGGVGQAGQDAAGPAPGLGHVDQAVGDREIDGGMDQIEAQRDQEACAGVFHIELHAQRRGAVADNGLGDAIDADGIVTEHVLRQA